MLVFRTIAFVGIGLLTVGCPVGPQMSGGSNHLSVTSTRQYVPIGCNQTWTVPANGGKPPYSFSIVSGPGSVNPTSGVYTSVGLSSAPTVIQVTDAIADTTTVQVNNVWTINGAVNAIAQDASNDLYIGGAFTWVCTYPGAWGAQIDSTTGSPKYAMDLNQNGGFNGPVYAWLTLADGSVIAGGDFTSYAGNAAKYIVKIDSNGAIDTTFNSGGTGFNGAVKSLALDSASQIYAGGAFTQYDGEAASAIAKLDPVSGALNTIFDSGGTGFNGTVESIAYSLYTGALYVGGTFTKYQTASFVNIAAINTLNGLPTTFNLGGAGFNGTVYSVAADKFGSVYAGGNFTQYDGSSANYIAQLVATSGALNTTFAANGGFDGVVDAIDVDSAGIIVGGSFSHYATTSPANNIAMLTSTGELSSTFDSGGAGFNGTVSSITSNNDGNVYVAGSFTTYNGLSAQYIAKLASSTGTLDTTFASASPPNAAVGTIYEDVFGNIYVGGSFDGFGGVQQDGIAEFNPLSGLDTTFNPAGSGFNGTVNALALDSSGNIFVGGAFTQYDSVAASEIAKLNTSTGALDTTFDSGGTGFTGTDVAALVLDTSGNIFVGGTFSQYGGSTANNIAKMDTTTGTLNTTFDSGGTGFNGAVNALALDTSGNVYIGGTFSTYRGSTANYIAKMDTTNGTLDATFDSSGTGFNAAVDTLALDTSGNIYIGGAFSTYRGSTANYIAKMDTTNGTLNSTFDPSGTGFSGTSVNAIALNGSGNLYAGGTFTAYRGSTAWSIAKMDTTNGTLSAAFDAGGSGFGGTTSSGDVLSLLLDGASDIFVGGTFSTYQTSLAGNFALIGN